MAPRRNRPAWRSILGSDTAARVSRGAVKALDRQGTAVGVVRWASSREVEQMDPDRSGGGFEGDERERMALRAALGFGQPEAAPIFAPDARSREHDDRADASDETVTAPVGVRRITEALESVRSDVAALGRRLDWVEQMVRAQAAQAQDSQQDTRWRRSSGS